MDWLRRLNEAITYIEDNLDGTIDYAQAAQKACCSAYHFQRMFSYMAEVPLSEYIRNRRLSRAAVDLQNGGDKVIDVAVKYGYDSPTAFTRAFQAFHGVTPTAAIEQSKSPAPDAGLFSVLQGLSLFVSEAPSGCGKSVRGCR